MTPRDGDPLDVTARLWSQEWMAQPLEPVLMAQRDYTAALAVLAFAAGLLLGVVLGRRS